MKALFGLLLGALVALGLFDLSASPSGTDTGINRSDSTEKFEGLIVDVLARQNPALLMTLSSMNASGLISPALHPATKQRLTDPAAMTPATVEKNVTRSNGQLETFPTTSGF